MAKTQSTPRLELLDGLRGIAAMAVMLFHVEALFKDYGIFSRGYLFVDFFFLLSGFVLTLSAEPKMQGGMPALVFLKARVVRLWPVIAIGTVIGALCFGMLDGWQGKVFELAMGLLLVPMIWSVGQVFPLNGPQWSLFLEIVANLIHGLVLHKLGERALILIVLASGALLLAAILSAGSNSLGAFAFKWWYAIPRIAFAYPLGIALARVWRRKADHRQILSWQASIVLPPLAVMALVAVPVSVAVGDAIVTLLVLPGLFWIAVHASPPPQARLWLSRIGTLSFPLYAVHVPFISLFSGIGQGLAWQLAAIAISLLAALMLSFTLERANNNAGLAERSVAFAR